jgi:hypothetical protein
MSVDLKRPFWNDSSTVDLSLGGIYVDVHAKQPIGFAGYNSLREFIERVQKAGILAPTQIVYGFPRGNKKAIEEGPWVNLLDHVENFIVNYLNVNQVDIKGQLMLEREKKFISEKYRTVTEVTKYADAAPDIAALRKHIDTIRTKPVDKSLEYVRIHDRVKELKLQPSSDFETKYNIIETPTVSQMRMAALEQKYPLLFGIFNDVTVKNYCYAVNHYHKSMKGNQQNVIAIASNA